MFWKSEAQELIEREIVHELRKLNSFQADSEDRQESLERLTLLYQMKEEEKSRSGISRDNVLVVVGNLLGILIIVNHENVNVITSKAIQLLIRPITRT